MKLLLLPIIALATGCALNTTQVVDMGYDELGRKQSVKLNFTQQMGAFTPSTTVVTTGHCHISGALVSGTGEPLEVCTGVQSQPTHRAGFGKAAVSSAINAAGFYFGLNALEPDEHNESTTVNQSGASASGGAGGKGYSHGGNSSATGGKAIAEGGHAKGGKSISGSYSSSDSKAHSQSQSKAHSKSSSQARNYNLNLNNNSRTTHNHGMMPRRD